MRNSNILFLSAGRRARLLMDARQSLSGTGLVVAADNNPTAPALYAADRRYTVPRIDSEGYVDEVLRICERERIRAVTTLIDPEIALLAAHHDRFTERGILPLFPDRETARLCFDKYEMFRYLRERGIRTTLTYHDIAEFRRGLERGDISFPVFMKPVSGSGSVGAHRVDDMTTLERDWYSGEHDYIIQELMTEGDCDADVYVDSVSHQAVAAFSKRKIETRIGGASKTISFKDPKLFTFIREVCGQFSFCGPLDMDFFLKGGEYCLSEINPRFGGAYLHAYGAGVDFFPLIANNINGIENAAQIGCYDEGIVMMMYDDVVIRRRHELVNDHFTTL